MVDEKVVPQGFDRPLTRALTIDPEVPPSAVLLMKSMFAGFANKTYRIRMSRTATLTTSGAGAMALLTTTIPSSFDQYSALAAIFSECRIRTTRISYTLNLNPFQTSGGTSGVVGGAFCSAFWPAAITGSTASVSQVTRLPKHKLFTTINTNWPISLGYRYPRGLPWSNVTAGSGGSDPEGGLRGGWCHVALSTLSNSVAYLIYVLEVDYEFRTLI